MPLQIVNQPLMRRVIRRPQHTFQLRSIPMVITPFMLAPVLPGETMKNLLMQSRVVSDPIKHPLIGWWNEYYFFYVKHRDLTEREEFTAMMVDPQWDASPVLTEDASLFHYFHAATDKPWLNWSAKCLERVVAEYFRNEDEEWDSFLIDGKPAAKITNQSWLDSVTNDADRVEHPELDVDLDQDSTITASEVERALAMWSYLREQGLTQQTYEEYLATYGVKTPEEPEEHKPELVRFVRDWSYPSNTVDPSNGMPSSALSWSVAERADKDRFFREPGFLYAVTVKRPKLYLSGQKGNAAAVMTDVTSWLPATFAASPNLSFKKIDALDGPLSSTTDDYWIDIRDLLSYGDQWINFALSETDAGLVALPTATLQKRYVPDLAAIKALFVSDTKYFVREDGIVTLQIAGRQKDMSPTT